MNFHGSRTWLPCDMSSNIKNPPLFAENDDYDIWKRDIELWSEFTDLPAEKKAIAIHLSLTGKARQASSELKVDELKSVTGVKTLLEKLDRVFLQDGNWKCFNAYLTFENYRREPEASIDDYLSEFDRRYFKLRECDVTLPDAIVACRLLKSCNLSDVHFQLALSTTSVMSFESMRLTLKKLFTDIGGKAIAGMSSDNSLQHVTSVKSEPIETFYGTGSRYNRGRGNRRMGRNNYRGNDGRKSNPTDYRGFVSKCFECGSESHWARYCPQARSGFSKQGGRHENYYGEEESELTLVANEVVKTGSREFSIETIGNAVLDSGCSRTVCGVGWFDCFLETLSDAERNKVVYEATNSTFKFGDGKLLKSIKRAVIPCQLAGKHVKIRTDVVESNIPLLFSKESMKKAEMKINLVDDSAFVFGREVQLESTSSGHYILPLCRAPTSECVHAVLFSCDLLDNDAVAKKLHRQFAHPSADRLKKLLKNAGRNDEGLLRSIDKMTDNCDTCKRFKKPPPRPIVSMPLGNSFNDTVSADLKKWKGVYFLVFVDVFSRYCQAVVIHNKLPATIITAFFTNWICFFGAPTQLLTDNGGEFSNDEMRSLSDRFDIKLLNTAAESPWSNGVCERLNSILGTNVERIIDDSFCSVEIALSWAVCARNALHNFSGFCPNQLVFGRNPSFPNVFDSKPPALEERTNSEVVAQNLNAMNSARREFIRNESDDRVRRALLRQVRDNDPRKFNPGDSVYFKRNGNDQWRGPARVIGRDGKQILVRHGGIVVRVHSCRAQHETDNERIDLDALSSGNIDPEPVNSNVNNEIDDGFTFGDGLTQSPIDEPRTPNSETDLSGNSNTLQDDNSVAQITEDRVQRVLPPPLDCKKMKVGQRISYLNGNDKEVFGQIVSRAGKVGGKYEKCYNVKQSSGEVNCVDLNSVRNLCEVSDDHEVFVSVPSDPVHEAKLKEFDSWKENDVFEEVEDCGQSVISVRWVVTEKVKEGNTITKARLVVRGFEEELLDRTDSPTCSKDSMRMALSIISSFGWKCQSVDVRCAFLQGKMIDRDVFVRPPPEFENGMIWRLKKSVYGLNDAARAWYNSLKKMLKDLHMKMSSLDPAFFFYHDDKDKLSGLMCVHVDDLLFAGDDLFLRNIVKPLMSLIKVGSTSVESFKYIGVNIIQSGQTIQLNQTDYIMTIQPIVLSKQRCNRKFDQLSKEESEKYRALIGQLNWISTQSRPDVAFSVCELSKFNDSNTVDNMLRANKVVKIVKDGNVSITFVPLKDLNSVVVECYSDASYANLSDGGSQGGYLVFIGDGNGSRSLVSWQSRRVRRVVKSTLAAEALALLDAAQAGVLMAHMLAEVLSSVRPIVRCYVDNRSLVESLYSTKSVDDKHLRIDMAVLRDMIHQGELQDVTWVQSAKQLANALTKSGASTAQLVEAMQ